ncbi:DUF6701 domain-containing protein [Pseudomonas sp. NPDC077382]
MSLASGDTLQVRTSRLGHITAAADDGFTLAGNIIGTNNNNITLSTGYSALTATGTNTIHGSVRSNSGAITLTDTAVHGSVESVDGVITLTNSSIWAAANGGGNVIGGGSVTTHNGTTIDGTLSNNHGPISLDGGRVGSINAAQDVSTSNGTAVTGALTASGDVTLGSRSSIGGKVSARNVIANETTFSGDITVTAGLVKLTGGSVTGNIGSNCCTITLNQVQVTGNVTTSQNNIVLDGSTVTGNLVTTHRVQLLNDSFVYGDVTAATWDNSTIYGTGSSHVYGVCTPSATNPDDLCDGVIVPTCLIKDKDKADNFDRSVLGSDWAVTSRNGDFGEPRIVEGRLRLTDDSREVSTGATIQRTFPAANNLITVTFKYYGYSSKSTRGADGIALILSDARVTPQPGAFGGSLGYAQKTGISGFAGGWLGIGFDEFGNYSNESEGRIGGVGSRRDTIAIRGSENSSFPYRYLTGVGAGEIDNGSSTTSASPGHLYRVTIDSRERGKTLITVERDTRGNGKNYITLIPAYDVQAQSSQASVPDNFWLSFTGSTGSYVNNHELDELQVCANRMDPVGTQIDHFEIVAPSSGLTCSPVPVSVKACLDSICTRYTEPVTANAVLSSGGAIISSDTQTFSGGTGSFSLRRTTKGSGTLGIASSNPATRPLSETLCKIGSAQLSTSCSLQFVDSGFVFDVPTQLSNKPSTDVLVSAVRKDDISQQCVPAFQNVEREVKLWNGYVTPSTSAGRSLKVNGNLISSAESAPTAMKLAFDKNAQAPISVRYSDAGKLELNIQYSGGSDNGDSGLNMQGSDQFVVKPVGFCIEPTAWESSQKGRCDLGDANCNAFVAAGDGFPVRFRPVGWESDDDPELCRGNDTTPNFRHGNIGLAAVLVAPADGVEGTVALAKSSARTYDHQTGTEGYKSSEAEVVQDVKFSEVGVFRISATPEMAGYLDAETVAGGTSANIGRVTPAYLEAKGAGELQPSCSPGYTFQEQPMSFAELPSLTITGKNRDGITTSNYDRGAFWKFPKTWSPVFFSTTGFDSLDRRIPANDSPAELDCSLESSKAGCVAARLGVSGAGMTSGTDATAGDGSKALNLPVSLMLKYLRGATPDEKDVPFDAHVEIFTGKAQLMDSDGVFVADPAKSYTAKDHTFSMNGTKILLGRYRLEGATGSELSPLRLPLVLERWSDSGFVTNTDPVDDLCAAVDENITLDSPSGKLTESDLADMTATLSDALQGMRQIILSEPGAMKAGSVRVEPQVPSWLYFDWLGTGPINPSAVATFGGYSGSRPLIFRREVYR